MAAPTSFGTLRSICLAGLQPTPGQCPPRRSQGERHHRPVLLPVGGQELGWLPANFLCTQPLPILPITIGNHTQTAIVCGNHRNQLEHRVLHREACRDPATPRPGDLPVVVGHQGPPLIHFPSAAGLGAVHSALLTATTPRRSGCLATAASRARDGAAHRAAIFHIPHPAAHTCRV